MPAGGRDEEGMGGMRERGAQAGGGIIASGGGRGEMRGREKAMGGRREETVSGGHPRGGAGTEGAGVATGQVAGGVPAVPMEGGKMEGGRHGRPWALPWLLVKEG